MYFTLCISDIHMSVHRKYISKLQPTRCNVSWFIYFNRCSKCFRRFPRPSSGAQNCTYSFRYCQPIQVLAWMPATGRQRRGCIISQTVTHSLVLLKMC